MPRLLTVPLVPKLFLKSSEAELSPSKTGVQEGLVVSWENSQKVWYPGKGRDDGGEGQMRAPVYHHNGANLSPLTDS